MNVKAVVKVVILLLLSGFLLCMTVLIIDGSAAVFPDCTGYITKGLNRVAVSEIDAVRDQMLINAQTVTSGYASSASGIYAPVEIVGTDMYYTDFHKLSFTSGGFFTADGGSMCAVISESLANTLYKSADIIGAKFYLSGVEVTVCGVYKPDKAFLSRIASDGKDYAFMPFRQSDTVDCLYTNGSETELNILLENKLTSYNKVDLAEFKTVVAQFKSLLFFLIGSVVLVALLIKLSALVCDTGTVKDTKFYIRLTALTVAAVAIPIIVSFDLYIPSGIIPADRNILDIPHYVELFVKFVQEHNTEMYYYYKSLYFWSVLVINPLIIINLLSVINAICRTINILKIEK